MFENRNKQALMTSAVNNANGDEINHPLKYFVQQALRNYLSQLSNQHVEDLYETVLSQIEPPMLDVIMQHTRGNQTQAANIMGINRGTLRKKLKKYKMN